MPERRGSMYDPARDTFVTPAEPAVVVTTEPTSSPSNKRKRSSPHDDNENESPSTQGITEPVPSGETIEEPAEKKLKLAPQSPQDAKPPAPVTSISQLPRIKKAPAAARTRDVTTRRPERSSDNRRRSRSPARQDERRARRTPPRRRTPSPGPIKRSPTPPGRSPPRQRKRPGAGAKVSAVDKDTVRQRQQEREQQSNDKAQADAAARGVLDVVKQHYNNVEQRGKEWRKTESHIRGLRSFNNWIKSAVIQKFSPSAAYTPGARERGAREDGPGLLVLDLGCGKGGDLQKWHAAPQKVDLYVGLDPADVSINQARDRYAEMQQKGQRGRGGYNNRYQQQQRIFHAEFMVKDCFGEWIGDIPIVQEVGIDGGVGGGGMSARFGGGGFDIVTMMFSMHYAFESEAKARGMLRNVAGALKKGGRFIGVVPNSDILTSRVNEYNAEKARHKTAATADNDADEDDEWDPEKTLDAAAPVSVAPTVEDTPAEPVEWGNSIYRVKFPGQVPHDGIFRPPFGWKYFFFLEEAVEEVPEYVVPWEAFRALAADYGLEMQYRKPFSDIYDQEKNDPILGPLSERMGVRERRDANGMEGTFLVNTQEQEAAAFYHAFCFYKV